MRKSAPLWISWKRKKSWEFDRILGLSNLKAIHLNDSMNGLGSHKDRHAKIGEGEIGLEALSAVTRHPVIGLSNLKAIHLNDSMNGLGSHKDRHAKIGEGEIGLEALSAVTRHPALKGIPFILETPNDDAGWTEEIALDMQKSERERLGWKRFLLLPDTLH